MSELEELIEQADLRRFNEAAYALFTECQRVNRAIKRHKLEALIAPMDNALIKFVRVHKGDQKT